MAFGLKWLFGSQAAADAATAALTATAAAGAGALVSQSLMPTIEQPDTTSSTATQYEAADVEETDISIGQEESTTSRKKKSNRGRTTPSQPTTPSTPSATQATSTGLYI